MTFGSRSGAWWRRASALLDELRDAGPAMREETLDASCTDRELKVEVEAWLAAMEAEGSSLLDTPVYESVPDLIAELDEITSALDALQPDRRIGPWRLIEEIGRGGSGVVFRAVRADGAYDQTVALKLLWGGARSPDMERRFDAERRILASLEHPNIARLIDGGMARGTPYLVMEHVDGLPITTWCRDHRASLERRLDLFTTVCDAVGHAHRNLVVHRDLKPSNILVTGGGDPKIVDFGIAKILVDQRREAVSETHVPMWTPTYASPEQIRGDSVTTATDVWALGAVLYRLLTGQDVRRLVSLTPAVMERAARAEPDRPSANADPQRTGIPKRRIAGDLDAIVATALRPEPHRRFASGRELAADLRRYAAGMPVEAREPTASYRLRKFMARQKMAVSAAATISLLVVVYAATLAIHADSVAAERDRARLEASKAEETVDFLGDLIWAAGPFVEPEIRSPTDLVEFAILRADSAFTDRPVIHGEILTQLGMSAYWMGHLDKARRLLQRAVAVNESTGVDGVDPATAWSAMHHLGSTRYALGNYEEAEATYRRVLEIYGPVLGSRSDPVAHTQSVLGWLYHETGDLDRAETYYRQALEIRREVPGPGSAGYATSLENLGLLFADQGYYAAGEPLVRAAFDIRQRVYGPRHVNTAYALRSLGRILYRRGREDEAEALVRTAVEIRRGLFGPTHHKYAEDLATLAAILAGRGELTEARRLLREALAIRHDTLGEDHPVTAVTRHQLATIHHRLSQSDEAEILYHSALESLAAIFGTEHGWTAGVRADLDRLERGRPPAEREWLSGTRLPIPQRIDIDPVLVRDEGSERIP